jgi:hypothetical protein
MRVAIWRSFSSIVLVSLEIARSIATILSSTIAVSVIIAGMTITRDESSEKADEVALQGDPGEEPDCESVLDSASGAE